MEDDIKTILAELKRKLKDYKLHQDSYSDVIPTLERMVKEHMTRYEKHAIPQEYGDEYAEIFIKATEPTVSSVDDQQSKKVGDSKINTIKSEKDKKQEDKKQAPKNNVTSNNKSTNGDKKNIPKSYKLFNNNQNNNTNKSNCNDTKTVKNDKTKSEEIKKSVPKMLPDKTRDPKKSSNKISSATDTVKRSVTSSSQVRPKSSMWPTVDRNVYNPLAKYKDEVDAAIKARKTFTVKGLQNLNASKNQIKHLLAETCLLDATLISLDVSNNLLNEENIMNVSKLLKLEKLNIAGNNLSFIPVNLFVNLTKLSYLNMSHNKISFLNYGALDHVKELKILDLSYNKLTTLKRYLHSLSALTSLYINNNKITNINGKQLLTDNNGLKVISIDSNDFNCENLVELIHDFKNKVSKGTSTIGSNIHGIACKEETLPEANPEVKLKADIIKYLETTISAKLEKSENLQFDRSLMYDYFNKDFKSSNFYKYLEGLKNINTLNFNDTDMIKYFNQDFKNSLFYKYLESLKANENSTREFNRSLYDYFNKDFNGTYLVKYLTKLEKSKDDFIDSFENSSMFNYFNKGFKNSTFYKYLENLNSKFYGIQQKDHGTAEYFHSSSEHQRNDYSPLLSMLSIIIVLLIILVAVQVYFNYNKKNIFSREQVELLDRNSIT